MSDPPQSRLHMGDMDVLIGATVEGRPVRFDLAAGSLLLIGDAGVGKTTIARYLTRWWLADVERHAHVVCPDAAQWADLRSVGQDHAAAQCRRPGDDRQRGTSDRCLVVVDDLDLVDHEVLAAHRELRLPAPRIATARSAHAAPVVEAIASDAACLALVRPEAADPAEAAVLDGQTRLDWPADTVVVIPGRRGTVDLPRHRWQAAPASWAVAT